MYGGYYVDQGPAGYHHGALYSDPRIAIYIGMGLHQMPGDVWWRTWRTLPPQRCATDPDFSWQGQWPVAGEWRTYTDPQSGKRFDVWEGHYTYPGSSLTYVPTWAGGMFEGETARSLPRRLQRRRRLLRRGQPGHRRCRHRRLVLDQSMIMAALDDVLHDGAMQRYFAHDPVSWAARLYLSDETMSIG